MRVYLFSFVVLFVFLNGAFASVSTHDNLGNLVQLKKPATRIISLAPDLTEMLFAIGAGSHIVGASIFSNYPAQAKKIPIISNSSELNLEAIVALKPDLIIAWQGGNPSRQLEKLKQLEIPVFIFSPRIIRDIPDTMMALGILTGKEKRASHVAKLFRQQLTFLKKHYAAQKRIAVFYEIWQKPLFTIGGSSLISQAIDLCGGRNVFATSVGFAPQVNIEAVLAANPDVIIGGYDDLTNYRWQADWLRWPQLSAVKNHRIYAIDPNLLQRFGPRFIQGMQQLCRDLALSRELAEKTH